MASTVLKAKGHTAVPYPEVEPTETECGYTGGTYCSVCSKELSPRTQLDPIPEDEYYIHYEIGSSDPYLLKLLEEEKIVNNNPEKVKASETVRLNDLEVKGYQFLGWYNDDGVRVRQISSLTDHLYLTAKFSAETYNIVFVSDMIAVENRTYQTNTGASLPARKEMEVTGYYFMGWSNEDGTILESIPKGSYDHITLYANYTSKRNSTIPSDYASKDPVIVDCSDEDLYLFMYEIGRIENIPLYQIGETTNKSGITTSETITVSEAIQKEFAENIAEVISNATTNSTSWTLSSDWNSSTSINSSQSSSVSSETKTESQRYFEKTGEFNISSGIGTTASTTNTAGVSSKSTTSETSENSVKASLNAELSVEETPITPGAKIGSSLEASETTGTTNTDEVSSSFESSRSREASWNMNSGFSASSTSGGTDSVSRALSQTVANTQEWCYNKSYGGSDSTTEGSETTTTSGREYASTFVYNNQKITSKTSTWSNENAPDGYYRWVCAGTAHVFAVVGYNLATDSYFVTTYSVMDSSTYTYVDYSMTTPGFDDYENGVLPFKVPIKVKNYVDYLTAGTDGLRVDMETGHIDGYTGTDNVVIIPQYISVSNDDGTNTAVEVTGIEPDVFAGNTSLEAVYFPDTVSAIPDGAFQGCTSLIDVSGRFTSIGANAFADCTSLIGFKVPSRVTSLGANAFTDVPDVTINAGSASVANVAVNCGAKSLVLNLSKMSDELSNTKLVIPETMSAFEFQGSGKTFTNVAIESYAATTKLTRASFASTSTIPVTIASQNVVLNQTSISAPGIALSLTADNANVDLYGPNSVTSSGETAILSKTIGFVNTSSSVSGKLTVTGDLKVLGVDGDATGTNLLSFTSGEVKYITETEYEEIGKNAVLILFDANEGSCSVPYGYAYLNTPIGELPTATRENYVFLGWFTKRDGGEQITSGHIFSTPGTITLHAHWVTNSYTVSWNEVTGVQIAVSREESPIGGAEIGILASGDTVYYGDVLSITYTAAEGYTIQSQGETSLTVEGDVDATRIFAFSTPNSYTYNIVYVSSNGTNLGTSTATYEFGTTNTISAPGVAGYDTPASQTVVWDSTIAKTITFTYTPSWVGNTTKNGYITNDTYYKLTYSATVEYRNRTATSVQVRVTWTASLSGTGVYNNYAQMFRAWNGSASTGNIQVIKQGAWGSSSNSTRSGTASSGWITIPLSTTNATSFGLNVYYYQANANGTDMTQSYGTSALSTTWTIAIPAY